jgi:hypothetical protein
MNSVKKKIMKKMEAKRIDFTKFKHGGPPQFNL